MRWTTSWSKVAVVAAVAMLPVKAGGCSGRTACFTFTQAAYAKNGGACPAANPALLRFSAGNCGFGPVSSVDGEGAFDGELCCYPVTQTSNTFFDCGTTGPGGPGGVGGSFVTSVGTGVSVGTAASAGGSFSTSSSAGGGSTGTCFTCNDELTGTSTDPGQLCPSAAMFWSALNNCKCGDGPCTTVCSASACMGVTPSAACAACIGDPGPSGCGAELASCKAN